ncbi:MAG: sensor histidine kinase [Bellilinea sp.]|jgi:two-component system nitrate/nitrite sensor histidine kinase NarX
MKKLHNLEKPFAYIPLLAGFLIVLGMEVFLRNQPHELIFWILAVLLAGIVSIITADWWQKRSQQREMEKNLQESARKREEIERRLNGAMRLNLLWMDVRSEKELIEKSLQVFTEMTGALGASFMPFDEWGQPLNAITHGVYPAPVLRAWAEHLGKPEVRNRCRVCQKLETTVGESCPLLEAPFTDSVRIFCLPLARNSQPLAMLNLYVAAENPIQAEMHAIIAALLREMLGALELIRLRGQELAALRQVHAVTPAESSLAAMILSILERLCAALRFPAARIDFRASPPHFEGLRLITGSDAWLNSGQADVIINRAMGEMRNSTRCPMMLEKVDDSHSILLAPCCLPGGIQIGIITLYGEHEPELISPNPIIIELVAAQCALLVESERSQQEREYRVILQERIRLAREIHDSLAQTLAYLKLTAAQMQNQLAQGDLNRLEQLINQSHQALADAYLETRQVIDNLRLTPAENMILWLEAMTREFEKHSGLKVNRKFPTSTPEVEPEVQAQLLRIIQEAFSNIRKHSKASSVGLEVRIWKGTLVLEISDDGVGFSAEDVLEFSRHGLRGMRERAELIGADFQVISKPMSGTTVRINLPINEETLV